MIYPTKGPYSIIEPPQQKHNETVPLSARRGEPSRLEHNDHWLQIEFVIYCMFIPSTLANRKWRCPRSADRP
jgi:hypothetical protein